LRIGIGTITADLVFEVVTLGKLLKNFLVVHDLYMAGRRGARAKVTARCIDAEALGNSCVIDTV